MDNNRQPWMRILVMGLSLLVMMSFFFFSDREITRVPFETFISDINEGKITDIKGMPDTSYTVLKGEREGRGTVETVVYNTILTEELKKDSGLSEKIVMVPEGGGGILGGITPFLSTIATLLMFFFLINIMARNSQGGPKSAMNFGKSRARLADPEGKSRKTFSDVAGAEEEKTELMEVVDFLKNPDKYREIGAKIPKGILLVGHPGTGKTLLARAVAGEAGVPFYIISGSDFVEMFVGVGASRVRDLFETAKKNAPSIIFLDEIDAVGRQRGTGFGGGHDEREQTLNQMLVEMDGFEENDQVVVIAATNRADVLDPALLRPGRFDRQIYIDSPDVRGREDILKIHMRNKPISDDVSVNVLAKSTPGFTGAELQNLTNEAAILAARDNRKVINMSDFEEARSKVQLGPEKRSRIQTEHTRRLTAFHEAGHAIVSRVLPNIDPVTEVSIIPRGAAGGYTMHLPTEDTVYTSRSYLTDTLSVLFGGRCAEMLILNDISTGAKSDIDRASKIARSMVAEYGMSDVIGNLSFSDQDEVFLGRDMGKTKQYSNAMGDLIDAEVKKLVDEAYKRAETILRDNMDKLKVVAEALLEKETLDAYEFEGLFTEGVLPPELTDREKREANQKVFEESLERKKMMGGEIKE